MILASFSFAEDDVLHDVKRITLLLARKVLKIRR